jgi:hypothetical protein
MEVVAKADEGCGARVLRFREVIRQGATRGPGGSAIAEEGGTCRVNGGRADGK